MNSQFKGHWQQFKGELKKKFGQFTDDLLGAEGNQDKCLGIPGYGDRSEQVERWTHDWCEREEMILARKAAESRNPK